jgi:hypothetical protein
MNNCLPEAVAARKGVSHFRDSRALSKPPAIFLTVLRYKLAMYDFWYDFSADKEADCIFQSESSQNKTT